MSEQWLFYGRTIAQRNFNIIIFYGILCHYVVWLCVYWSTRHRNVKREWQKYIETVRKSHATQSISRDNTSIVVFRLLSSSLHPNRHRHRCQLLLLPFLLFRYEREREHVWGIFHYNLSAFFHRFFVISFLAIQRELTRYDFTSINFLVFLSLVYASALSHAMNGNRKSTELECSKRFFLFFSFSLFLFVSFKFVSAFH